MRQFNGSQYPSLFIRDSLRNSDATKLRINNSKGIQMSSVLCAWFVQKMLKSHHSPYICFLFGMLYLCFYHSCIPTMFSSTAKLCICNDPRDYFTWRADERSTQKIIHVSFGCQIKWVAWRIKLNAECPNTRQVP